MNGLNIADLLKSQSNYVRDAATRLATGGPLTGNQERRLSGLMGREAFGRVKTAAFALAHPTTPTHRQKTATRMEDVEALLPALRAAGLASGTAEGGAISLVGSDGKLNTVAKRSNWTTPSAYPTELRSVASGVTNKLNSSGLESSHASFSLTFDPSTGIMTLTRASNSKKIVISVASIANDITIDANGIKVLNASSSNYAQISNAGVITAFKSSGSLTLTIDPAVLTHNMSLQTIQVCDTGTQKSMDVIASAPY